MNLLIINLYQQAILKDTVVAGHTYADCRFVGSQLNVAVNV
jgi:hypothetical protein